MAQRLQKPNYAKKIILYLQENCIRLNPSFDGSKPNDKDTAFSLELVRQSVKH
ncbi:hypothetical protein [Flectobacillus roseus]|uniref:hypothetical protein n=1 Tax=Flectobacillus roseus TaxID=502259 RepID=UPI0024B7C9EA|nr:hypothetical protein [Flectobacillus roseus]MDI9869075.1 hypothetical protein [Flectobacillus roseus]